MLPAMLLRQVLSLCLMLSLFGVQISAKDKNDNYIKPGPIKLDRDGEKWAEKTLKKMSSSKRSDSSSWSGRACRSSTSTAPST